ncbi:essential MCU regulator, mitochondrial [Heteronotia binoei]|uniref:essential MCU regulator, mitochondrial n=1 Tax=Heteronotia binoei TaxID=13085 RepID=UPI00292DDB08|nr:essential MCU regulator, mitochondrial [Heteronotia binoei]
MRTGPFSVSRDLRKHRPLLSQSRARCYTSLREGSGSGKKMAGRLLAAVGSWRRAEPTKIHGSPSATVAPSRSITVTQSGAILPKPVKMPFGLLRVFSVVIPFLYVGTQISKSFAALLEEHDIFVPEDDDDDD